MKILAVDYGEKFIGLAFANTDSILIAQPQDIIANNGSAEQALKDICSDLKIEQIILGYPRTLDGGSNQQTRVVEEFGDKLKASIGLPLKYQDETLSSAHVREQLSEDKKGQKKRIDDQAAALILQDYLEQEFR